MQNLPITTATQPATPAQMPNPANNNTAQAAETFGNVLARQRANSGESNTAPKGKGQTTSSAAPSSSTDNLPAATGNELEAHIPEVISTLPGDMLAALLPSPANANSIAAKEKEKPVSQAPTPDGVSTLPSDMLAALLSTTTTVPQGASTATRQQPAVTDAQSGARQELIAAGAQSGVRQELIAAGAQSGVRQELIAAGAQGGARQQFPVADTQGGAQQFASAGQSIAEQTATSLFRAQSNATQTAAVTDSTQGKTFSTALETMGKDAANTALPDGTTQLSEPSALPDAITMASLTQSPASSIAASQNGPVQVAINSPVTHDKWGDEFNQKITWIATQHEQTAELHLNPPHLGPLDVVLNISGDQATALFTSPHAAVRDAVEQALPKLREMLADNGIMLGNAMVNDQSPKEQQAWLADKQHSENKSLPGGAGDAVPASGTVWPARRHQGMVDTFV